MASNDLPDIEDLRNRVDYNPETGALIWRERPVCDFKPTSRESAEIRCRQWNTRCAGKPAFASVNTVGYAVGHFRAKLLAAHRVAFAIKEGRWPAMVDHANGNRVDNRWMNIRETTPARNLMNCRARSDSPTGRTGVKPNRRTGRGYIANIKVEGRLIHLGAFDTFEEGVAARQAAEKVLGFSARHGKAEGHIT